MNKEQLIADIKAMSVLELHELVKALEEEFGVSAAATAVAVAGPVAAADKACAIGGDERHGTEAGQKMGIGNRLTGSAHPAEGQGGDGRNGGSLPFLFAGQTHARSWFFLKQQTERAGLGAIHEEPHK